MFHVKQYGKEGFLNIHKYVCQLLILKGPHIQFILFNKYGGNFLTKKIKKITVYKTTVKAQNKPSLFSLLAGRVTNIPQGMVADQFGIVGLLTFIRCAETDHSLNALAPGLDLTTLGLNLNSPE